MVALLPLLYNSWQRIVESLEALDEHVVDQRLGRNVLHDIAHILRIPLGLEHGLLRFKTCLLVSTGISLLRLMNAIFTPSLPYRLKHTPLICFGSHVEHTNNEVTWRHFFPDMSGRSLPVP